MVSRLLTGLLGAAIVTGTSLSNASVKAPDQRPASELSARQRKIRLHHAHELLGRYYKKSSANVGESIPKINSAVYHWTKDHLPTKYKPQSGKIAQTIIDVSMKQEFDPVFLMSVIEGESSWRPELVGGVGEIGLMQIRPTTAKWMAQRAGVKWQGKKTLLDPCTNIKIGAAYLSYLRDRFDDHARLYLAAYNMGQSNVDNALDKKIWPKDYPIHIMKRYISFYEALGPMLHTKAKSSDKMRAVANYSAVPKKTKPSARTSDFDRMPSAVNTSTAAGNLDALSASEAEIEADIEAELGTTAAAGSDIKLRAEPNRS